MAVAKISDLAAANTPLVGTEQILLTQSGASVQTVLANLPISTETQNALNQKLSSETVTSLTFDNSTNTFTYTDENSATTDISLSVLNTFIDTAAFDTANGELTLTRTDAGTVTVDLDGRYLLTSGKAADAELLDGETSTYYLDYTNFSNTPSLYGSTDFDTDFGNKDTDNLSEGTSNLYYTDTRTRNAISAGGDLSYNSNTGEISFTERTDAEVRGLVSASGDLSYNSSTGEFSVTTYKSTDFDADFANKSTTDLTEGTNLYYTDARVDSHLLGGTGVDYSTGTISIGQAVGTTDNVTFNDLTVSGNLTVQGTTTTVNTEEINLADNKILLNSNFVGASPTENGGIEIERGDLSNKSLEWNETDDKWTVKGETLVAGVFEGDVTGNVTGTVSDISNHTTDDLSEGTNLYYTDARAKNAISAGGDLSYNSSTGTFSVTTYKSTDFDTDFGNKSTDDLSEGTSNLYFTDSRAQSVIDTNTAGFITDYTVTQGDVTQHQSALSITESQISDLQNYITSEADTLNSVTGRGNSSSNAITVGGLTSQGLSTFQQTTELLNTKTGASGTVTHDFSTGAIWYHSSISADFTANFTNVPTTADRAISVVLVLDQGATGFLSNAVQIDGAAQTINWSNGEVPSATSNAVDIVSFTLIRTGASWTVLGSLTSHS